MILVVQFTEEETFTVDHPEHLGVTREYNHETDYRFAADVQLVGEDFKVGHISVLEPKMPRRKGQTGMLEVPFSWLSKEVRERAYAEFIEAGNKLVDDARRSVQLPYVSGLAV